MTRSRRIIAALVALAGFAAAVMPLPVLAEEPCVELRFRGKDLLAIPCPGELAEILDLPFLQAPQPEEDRFNRRPDAPGDHGMVIDPEERDDRSGAAGPEYY